MPGRARMQSNRNSAFLHMIDPEPYPISTPTHDPFTGAAHDLPGDGLCFNDNGEPVPVEFPKVLESSDLDLLEDDLVYFGVPLQNVGAAMERIRGRVATIALKANTRAAQVALKLLDAIKGRTDQATEHRRFVLLCMLNGFKPGVIGGMLHLSRQQIWRIAKEIEENAGITLFPPVAKGNEISDSVDK
jgi:hypothetical protein